MLKVDRSIFIALAAALAGLAQVQACSAESRSVEEETEDENSGVA